MASKLSFKRTITDKVSVRGRLSDDGTFIIYEDDKNKQKVKIADLLNTFKGRDIDFSASLKTESALDVVSADEE